jgi:hypothetical protein
VLGQPSPIRQLTAEGAGEFGLSIAAWSAFGNLIPIVGQKLAQKGLKLGPMLEILL